MAIVGSNAGRASFQYFNGSNYVEAQTPGGNNALTEISIQENIYNPMKVSATLINKATNPRSGTASATKGNLTGTITAFMKVRIVDAYSKQIMFSGFAEDVQEKYVMGMGNILVVRCYDNLYELKDYRTDSLIRMDTTDSAYNRRSRLIAKMIDFASKTGNLATSDTDQFETSTIEFAAGTGDFHPKEAGKTVLAAIKQIATTEPHTNNPSASVSQTAFGHDFYLAPQFTSTATSATQTPMLNYFKRATRPNTEANMDTYGMKIVFPLSSSDTEGGQTRRMLSDFDFDRVRTDMASEAQIKFVDKGGKDGSAQGQSKKFAPLRIARLNPTAIGTQSGVGAGVFTWTERPLAGDYTVNGNYVYTDGKEGNVHPTTSTKDEVGGGWLVRMWANTIGSGGSGAYRTNFNNDIAHNANSSYAFSNSWMKYIAVPENDDNNSTPCGKVRISSIETTNLASKDEVIVNTATNHFLQAGDRFILSNIHLGATGEITENAQQFQGTNVNGRAFGRETLVATAIGNMSTSNTDLIVNKNHRLTTGATDSGTHVKVGASSLETMEVTGIAKGNLNFDTATVTRGHVGSGTAVSNTATSDLKAINVNMIHDSSGLKEQEGGGNAIFDHNIFRVERVISTTQFIVKSNLAAVSWTSGTLKCGLLKTAINDSASTTDVVLKTDGTINGVHVQAGMIIKIGSEEMLVKTATYDSGDADLVVERGYNGTSRASHSADDEVISMLSHIIPIVGRAQFQTKLNSWSSGTDYMLVSDLNSNFPTTGHFRLAEILYNNTDYGSYAEFNSSSLTINNADVMGFNKPKVFTASPMDKNADGIRIAVSEALSFEDETRGGTVRINNYPYQYIDGTANSVGGSGTVVTTYNTANDAALNPEAYGLRVGMVAWKLSGTSMAAYGYVSATSSTTFTVTLNSGTFSADDKFRIFVPLRTGHLVQIKNKLVGIDTTSSNTFSDNQTSFMVSSIDYTEGQGQQTSTINLVKADEGNMGQTAFAKIAQNTEVSAYSTAEDEIVEHEPPTIDVNFRVGTLRPATDGSTGSSIENLHSSLHWEEGLLKYKGEEYIILPGNSIDGYILDNENNAQGGSSGAQLFNRTDTRDSEDRTSSDGGGADGVADAFHVCFVDLGNSSGSIRLNWVQESTYQTQVKDKASKLIIAYGFGSVNANGNAYWEWASGINHIGKSVTTAAPFVGQGYGKGSASAAVFSFDEDTNTGIYSSGDNKINFTSNGTPFAQFENEYSFIKHLLPYATSSFDLGFVTGSAGTSDDFEWRNAYLINAVSVSSDKEKKKDIKPIQLGLDFINDLNPVSYKWKDENLGTATMTGIIAQEVEEVLAKHGINDLEDFAGIMKGSSYHAKYEQFIAILMKAIQELSQQVKELKEKFDA